MQAGSDPVFRVKLMKADGVSAEVLNPTFALWVPRIPDPAMRRACAEVFNDWIVEYCASASERLLGVAIVPIDDPDWSVNEAKRIIRRGARGIMVPTQPIEGAAPYRSAVYDSFWANIGRNYQNNRNSSSCYQRASQTSMSNEFQRL